MSSRRDNGPRLTPARAPDAPPSSQALHNIDAILSIRARPFVRLRWHQRLIERSIKLIGRPSIVFALVLASLTWIAFNIYAPRVGLEAWDPPPFATLELVVSVAALVIAVTILSVQNRERQTLDERAHLELQVNLLAEQKITKLIALVEELRRDLPDVRNRVDPVAEQMQEAVDPHAVLDALAHDPDDATKPEPDSGHEAK